MNFKGGEGGDIFEGINMDAFTEMMYETTRKGKMWLKNDRRIIVGVADLLDLLKGIDVQEVLLRVFFTRYTTDPNADLLVNYPEKFLIATLVTTLVQNFPLQFKNIHTDGTTYIFDIIIQNPDYSAIRKILKDILSNEHVSYVDRVEVKTKGNQETLYFNLLGRNQVCYPNYTLFQPQITGDIIPPIHLKPPVTHDFLEEYFRFLEQNYEIFYNDVKFRYCTLWTAPDGRNDYLIKRQIGGEYVMFPSDFEDALPILQIERIVGIIPNSLPESEYFPIECCIDIDIHNDMPYNLVKQVTDAFADWLVEKDLLFHRRLTGSAMGGQHFILPLSWSEPAILAGKSEVFEVYGRRTQRHILCDSVRDAAELLCLLFQIEKPYLAPMVTTRIFDPYSRYRRILFDVSTNAFNRGRRALGSLHHGTLHLCVPLRGELPATPEELMEQTELDGYLITKKLQEPLVTTEIQTHNTFVLYELINRYERVYQEYHTSCAAHFEECHFKIPINRVSLPEDREES